ncbi:MAG: RHS repeat-associated core domain-containing protein [Saprospiraceae bacterium]|nr:RHS repeat-associated core domain-containing protein [Saprospiraceae bacterium]
MDQGGQQCIARTHTDMGHDGVKASEHKYFGQDVTGYVLNYFDGDYQNIAQSGPLEKFEGNMGGSYAFKPKENLYNGNIRAMVTAIRPFMQAGSPAGYNYRYDQLHRIKGMDYYSGMANNDWAPATVQNDYETRYSYDANGNIKTLDRKGAQAVNLDMDNLTYHYAEGNNRLTHVGDVVSASNYATDIDDQAANNYHYDRNGNLIRDKAEGLTIEWNLSGKVRKITKDNGTIITFRYDALGNRIMKSHNDTLTWYVRDASGNPMAHYGNTGIPVTTVGPTGPVTTRSWEVHSWTLYGSARLGEFKPWLTDPLLTESEPDTGPGGSGTGGAGSARLYKAPKPLKLQYYRGRKQYELTNHLGNVLATVSDRKLIRKAFTTETGLFAHVITAQDYYPFGSPMPNRNYSSEKFRHGFNGQEKDDEVKGVGISYFYEARVFDPRLGRWLSKDPYFMSYTSLSPYNYSFNSPLKYSDPDGKNGTLTITKISDKTVQVEIVSTIWVENSVTDNVLETMQAQLNSHLNSKTINGEEQGIQIVVIFNISIKRKEEKSNPNPGDNEAILNFQEDRSEAPFSKTSGEQSENNKVTVTTSPGNKMFLTNKATEDENGNTIPHEFLHLLGLIDRYKRF